jgi:outer membrane protein OmpU
MKINNKGEIMNNLKKIGLTALAGTLASVAANAGAMDVSGTAKLSYVSEPGEATGNPFGMNTGLAFSGSGEMDNGMNVSYYTASGDKFTGQTSGSLTLDMGDSGTFVFDQGTGQGMWAIRDKLPRVGEESWDSISSADGMVGFGGSSGKLVYKNSMSDVNYAVSYMNQGSAANADGVGSSGSEGSSMDISGDFSPADGLTVWAGYGKRGSTGVSGDDDTQSTAAVNYAMGMITVGVQQSLLQEGDTGGTDQKMLGLGISVSINENLSVSWNERETTFDAATATDVDAKTTGVGIAYTMGSMSITAQRNEGDNLGGVASVSDEDTEIAVAFAF